MPVQSHLTLVPRLILSVLTPKQLSPTLTGFGAEASAETDENAIRASVSASSATMRRSRLRSLSMRGSL